MTSARNQFDDTNNSSSSIPWPWVKQVRHIIDNPPPGVSTPTIVEVVPSWLYISDVFSIRDDPPALLERGITHVLSVNAMDDEEQEELADMFRSMNIIHKYVAGEDEEGYDMMDHHWAEILEFLQSARNHHPQSKIVIHCLAGINRSGLVVAAAHLVLTRTPLVDVVHNLVQKRGRVLWNQSFQLQLCVLAAKEGLLGNRPPAGYTDDPIVMEY